jgi:peptidoglycan biosynthesis protein MviN/MurJ (putative lipid II flippase)
MSAALWYFRRPLDWWVDAGTLDRSVLLGTVIVVGAFVYFATLAVLGLRLSQFRLSGPSRNLQR